jgi:chromosome partitioning protein
VAAREVFIPIQCEYYALEGVTQLEDTINRIGAALNPDLRLTTILLTMFDGRTRLAQEVAENVRTHFPDQTLGTIIPRTVRVSEAPSYGQTILTYDPQSIGAVSYLEAAHEMANRHAATTGRS